MGASTRVPGSNKTPADSDSQSLFTELHVHNLCKQSLKELLALSLLKAVTGILASTVMKKLGPETKLWIMKNLWKLKDAQ